jgi:hypothetical protein
MQSKKSSLSNGAAVPKFFAERDSLGDAEPIEAERFHRYRHFGASTLTIMVCELVCYTTPVARQEAEVLVSRSASRHNHQGMVRHRNRFLQWRIGWV